MNIKVNNLTKIYGNQTVLNSINFEISNVGAVGIIGESGCGKSTLLRQLAGIESPEKGEIQINGLDPIKNKRQFQNKIGYVFQKHNLFPHLTIEKNITLILEKIKGISKPQCEKITAESLEKLHITAEKDKLPKEVSGGQAQRASIARALATSPELIFLDEPTASLDPILSGEVLSSIKELKETGVEFLFVTHEMQFLKEFCDYFIFMNKGEIVEMGECKSLSNPKTQQLQSFLQITSK
ncbi:MAG: ATP-binding cassette domain-containing protein [Bacillota bacterium]